MAKGSSFEREICTKLSQWWAGDSEVTDLFWRTAGSGGRATVRLKKGQSTRAHVGDICATDTVGEPLTRVFAMELKRGYNRATFAELIDKPPTAKKQTYEDWIKQARRSKKAGASKYWLILHKRDRRQPIVLVPKNFVERHLSEHVPMAIVLTEHPFCVYTLDNFLKFLTPSKVIEIANA